MELKYNSKKFFLISTLILLVVLTMLVGLFSCKNESTNDNGDCICETSEKPDSAFLNIKVTINDENPYVLLTVYKDKFDPNRTDTTGYLSFIDTARTENYRHFVPVDSYYSVKAKYKSGNKIIYAIDGGVFQAQQESGCSNTCWQMVGGQLDARFGI